MNNLAISDHRSGLEIAIIGMSGRFPGARDIEAFWQNLRDGVESVSALNEQDLMSSGVVPALLNDPNYVRAIALLEDIELFDAAFFGFTPREAEVMDPQQRLFLECAWEALENAGYNPEIYEGSIGVYAGASMSGYLFNLVSNRNFLQSAADMSTLIGNDKDFLATRVSYKLNLEGPSIAVQTACSTSLVAVHLACQGLLSGECDMALAGGVSITVPQKVGYLYQEGGIASPDGHCRAFDACAQGTVGGSGVGIVVLKRLEDALVDGDCILAVIKGSAVNNDGALKVGYTAPRIDGQAKVIMAAQVSAGVEAETITYIEAHGTGTPLGDPIEIMALTQAFRASTEAKRYCAIGSVKTNIGHLDAAAGIAGLIKTVLALEHKLIPPSLHFREANPQIDFANSPFYVNTTLSEWRTGSHPRRAGVSSFGMGGTNAHVVLEEAPLVKAYGPSRPWQLLTLSAKSSSALDAATENLVEYFKQHPEVNLADVAYTLQLGRKAMPYRRMLVCRSCEEAVSKLETRNPAYVFTRGPISAECPVVFMFSGQGTQYVNMGKELYCTEPVFRDQVDRCAELLIPHLGLDLRQILYPKEGQTEAALRQLNQTALTQPALFMIEYALAKLCMTWGVRPQAMIGHSIGEYVAACLADVLSLENALALVAERGRLMQQLPVGTMLAVLLPENQIHPLMDEELSLAAINSPSHCVISGSIEALERLQKQLAEQGVESRRLQTSHAFHSQMMDPIVEPFKAFVRGIKTFGRPKIPYISNVTGTWITGDETTDASYWTQHLRQTVRFSEGVHAVLEDPVRILLEIGPGQTLSALAKQQAAERVVISSLRRANGQGSDEVVLLNTVGRLWLEGVPIDWRGYYANERRHRIPLPTYPFERQRYWVPLQQQAHPIGAEQKNVSEKDIADWFYIPSWKRSLSPAPNKPDGFVDSGSPWLVFVDECGLGTRVVQSLQEKGGNVTTVTAGERLERLTEGSYCVNPQEYRDYIALLHDLRTLNQTPTNILHFWSITSDTCTPLTIEVFEKTQIRGFYSLLFLAQAFGELGHNARRNVVVVSNDMHDVGGGEVLCPAKSTLLGLCKVIPQEYPTITCRSIDLSPAGGSTGLEAILPERIIADACVPSADADTVVAYRGNHRWVQSFEPVRLDSTSGQSTLLRDRGVYLITGGLGGVGLWLAEYLARTVRARLVLMGRSKLPARDTWGQWLRNDLDRDGRGSKVEENVEATQDSAGGKEDRTIQGKLRKVQELEQLGAEVLVLSADVADHEQMQEVVNQAYAHFGEIHGVIHAAAIAGGGMIDLKTPHAVQAEFSPKVRGTLVLDTLFKHVKLDFLALCSSLSAITGGLGQVAYCAANAFIDAFSHYSTHKVGTYTVSINWDRWRDVGLAADVEARFEVLTIDDFYVGGMTPNEGQEVFKRVLCQNSISQIVVSTHELVNLSQQRAFTASNVLEKADTTRLKKLREHPRPQLSSLYIAPRNSFEQKLTDIWKAVFGIDRVGIYDNFYELGGESLLALQILNRVREAYQVELSLRQFFEAPTVAGVCELIEKTGDGGVTTQAPAIMPLSRDAYRLCSSEGWHEDFQQSSRI